MSRNEHESNRLWWEEVTPIHAKSDFYDVEGFLKGRSSLKPIETGIWPEVEGKSLLHLQCHFGLDTLSWARRGAKAVGVDFSFQAIEKARELAEKTVPETRFVQSDVLELDKNLEESFDHVFTSYGAVCWLSDIVHWGKIVAGFLKKGGSFLIVEVHPLSQVFDEDWDGETSRVKYPYFPKPEGLRCENDGYGDYADKSYIPVSPSVEWNWSVADVQNALRQAGLRIGELKEYPFTVYPQFLNLEKSEDGLWRRPKGLTELPLLYSLTATKD